MARGMSDMLMLFPLLMLMNQIDWTNPNNILAVRIACAATHALVLLCWGYIFLKVRSTVNSRIIKVPPPQVPFAPSDQPETEMTITEYDKSQIMKAVKQIVTGLCMIGFIHFKWGYVQPLFMQTFMIPMQLFKNPLFQIFVLSRTGEDLEKRPFKEENPFAAFMPPEEQQQGEQQQGEQQQGEQQQGEQQQEPTQQQGESNKNKKAKKATKAD